MARQTGTKADEAGHRLLQAPGLGTHSPVQQRVVQVLAQALQDLVMVADGRGLVLTCGKVALQLEEKTSNVDKEQGYRSSGIKKAAEKTPAR